MKEMKYNLFSNSIQQIQTIECLIKTVCHQFKSRYRQCHDYKGQNIVYITYLLFPVPVMQDSK